MGFEWIKPDVVLGSIMYALIGVIIFWLCFVIIDKITPYDLWAEIVEKQNRALALEVAAMSLGICIIIAAAIHGQGAASGPGASLIRCSKSSRTGSTLRFLRFVRLAPGPLATSCHVEHEQ